VYGLAGAPPASAETAAVVGGRRAQVMGQVMGVRRPGRRDRRDLERAVVAVAALGAVAVAAAVVVDRSHVLAIEPGDGAAMMQRVSGLRQWGMRGRGRSGVCAVRAGAGGGFAELLCSAAAQRLAGVAVIGGPRAIEPYARAVQLADKLGLFLVVVGEQVGAP
jgi:DUF1009 family protein